MVDKAIIIICGPGSNSVLSAGDTSALSLITGPAYTGTCAHNVRAQAGSGNHVCTGLPLYLRLIIFQRFIFLFDVHKCGLHVYTRTQWDLGLVAVVSHHVWSGN